MSEIEDRRINFKNTMDYARWRRELIREVTLRVCGATLARADMEYAETLKSAKKAFFEDERYVRSL